ncbi:MAG: PIN domain-containing protein [Bacteroidia bacterium]|nr:PIN domain-containing protein [Bacteroidia bacterium]
MKKVLFDTNIILDIALKRKSFFDSASQLFSLIDQKIIEGCITASTVTDIYYISKKEKGHNSALQFIAHLIEIVDVIDVDKEIIIKSLASRLDDFEDAIQTTAAELNGVESIITRNKKDFVNSSVEIYTPDEFLKNFS